MTTIGDFQDALETNDAPDMQQTATLTVLEQVAVLSQRWATA
jgi:hypothetical protein